MSSTIQVYTNDVVIEEVTGQRLFGTVDDVQVTIKDVDASDIVPEFIVSELLDAIDFADIEKYYLARKGDSDDEDFSGAE